MSLGDTEGIAGSALEIGSVGERMVGLEEAQIAEALRRVGQTVEGE